MAEPKSVFDDLDEGAETRAIAEAEGDVEAGRVVPHEEVVEWLKSWGTPDELPSPPKR
ncbi:MAG TPA: CopG family transcriptional regulator [Stellaceae bacterium]|nr:CopG family transcriptional regulator [Stellaceae bacterium]